MCRVTTLVVSSAIKRRREALQKFVHFLTAFVIALKGVSKLEHASKYLPFIIVFFIAALFIVLGALFHHRLAHRFRYFDAFFFAIEAIVLFLVAYLHARDGATALQYVIGASALMYLVAIVIFVMKKRRVP